ncbi:hypothetical protein LWI29_019439 [Acer saccharum]|uniref:Uncharacterized protein n=1 Tax=Acer saccharum TaxID=4024 RepID=A0AA39THR1_ACESA|nr:hypothetical protein LWI29_019439 [Acer saccharum]
MDFYEQHAYDEDSEAMNELIMKLVVATEQMVELKSMIFAREQTQAMNSYNPWPINEINTYEQLVSPSLKEAFNNIMQSIQQLWDEAATMPSYGTMDFYEQHAYDEDSEAMNELIMKLVVATEQMVELKSMIFAREQTQAMNSYNPWPINEINTYEQLVSPSLKEAFNNIMQSIQQLWDEAATMPSYGTMDFYEQHAYDEDSEAMNELIMKLVVATEQMVELKSMIFAREQTQAMNSYNPWPINEINTYEQLVSPSLKEAFNNIMQSIQQLWDEAATMPSYGLGYVVLHVFVTNIFYENCELKSLDTVRCARVAGFG